MANTPEGPGPNPLEVRRDALHARIIGLRAHPKAQNNPDMQAVLTDIFNQIQGVDNDIALAVIEAGLTEIERRLK